eukprot:CAMPEP_0115105870 /NCGR_PEP_ID=MMETSP0227-20121206/36279_1 /TAXON_ID=89957 /ORGANISM="Polarella glacialis, Strain CCMP 1383" /LENGTH=280 /DNA_ID=CAMNT_0002503283 /DNA_START=192 /DNA_END=1035 /DNA_ORIENTATION=-
MCGLSGHLVPALRVRAHAQSGKQEILKLGLHSFAQVLLCRDLPEPVHSHVHHYGTSRLDSGRVPEVSRHFHRLDAYPPAEAPDLMFHPVWFLPPVPLSERLALAAGLEHITVFRFSWREAFGFHIKRRPVEIFMWKAEELPSSGTKVMKANDIFVECHMGHNEPMRTRVHNNAGSECFLRESFQLNLDESDADSLMTLFIKDQGLAVSSELARLTLSTREICGIEDQTGKRRSTFDYSAENFVQLKLSPTGWIWIAVSPVDDAGDDERAPLMQEDSLMAC